MLQIHTLFVLEKLMCFKGANLLRFIAFSVCKTINFCDGLMIMSSDYKVINNMFHILRL